MNAFRVWVRPLGGACRIRVDGVDNANWLLDRLGESYIFKNSEPVQEERDSSCCSFRVPYNSQAGYSDIERLLSKIPEATLEFDPA